MAGLGESILLKALGWAVLNSLWQMALLWMIYQLILTIYKYAGSHQKSKLATIILFSGFLWFVFTFISILITDSSADHSLVSLALVGVEGNERLDQWLQTMLPVASLVYILLLIIPVFSFLRNYRFVRIIRRHGLSKANVEWRIFIRRMAAELGIKKTVQIWISDLITSPVTIGFIKPIILVPLAAVNHLSTQQMEAVLLHELSHIRRFDYIINLMMTFIRTILYFNPFVKLFVKTIEREREKSCDEMVIQFQYDPHGYASALLLLERNNVMTQAMAIAAGGKKNDLLHRVERILRIEKRPIVSFNKLAGLFAGLLCVIAVNAIIILSKPVNQTQYAAFNQLGNPFYFFVNEDEPQVQGKPVTTVSFITGTDVHETITNNIAKNSQPIQNPFIIQSQSSQDNPLADKTEAHGEATVDGGVPGMAYMNAAFEIEEEKPSLKRYQEEHVTQTLELTKKVLKEKEWKQIEKNIADAFTKAQKFTLKNEYLKEVELIDWQKMQEQLSQSYQNINWDQINDQLSTALTEIKLDSLKDSYTESLSRLNQIESFVTDCANEKVIPDRNVTMLKIQQNKEQAVNLLKRVKAVRSKKIVHL